MADKKIFDLSIGLILGIFCLSIFFYMIYDMDNNTKNNDNLYLYLQNTQQAVSNNDSSTRINLDYSTFGSNSTSFEAPQYQFIDTRGTGQANTVSTSSKGTITIFFNNIFLTNWDYHGLIIGLILSLIGLVVVVLLIRLMLGSYRS